MYYLFNRRCRNLKSQLIITGDCLQVVAYLKFTIMTKENKNKNEFADYLFNQFVKAERRDKQD